ncbi:hypothetical protein WJX84_002133 [Apatococcus fuscideae]|uniref:NADP-dependent oxidoreductase domain-containing protein n=1 Tax=Apatococcus fuscideae TaxID=2026836 RepID=A0AAW1SPC6_9CHLO
MAASLPQRTLGEGTAAINGSAVAFGAMSLYGMPGAPDEEASMKVIRHSLSCGINIINTSDLYGHKQENEIMIGKAIKGIPRESVIIVDKWGVTHGPNGFSVDGSAATFRRGIDLQLARLGTEYIDVSVYRGKDPKVPIEETMLAMKEAVTAGKVKHIGLSECGADDIRKAHAIHPITFLEQEWSLFTRDIEEDLLPTANQLGIGILAYSPLGRGMLTGSIRSPADLAENDFRRISPRFAEDAFKQNLILVDKLEKIAQKKGCTTGQLAIAWLLHKSPTVIPLFGTKSIKNLEANAAAASLTLTPEEFQAIDTSFSPNEVQGERYPAAMMGRLTYNSKPQQ